MTWLFWVLVPALTVVAFGMLFGAWWVYLPAVWWEHRRDCVRCFDRRVSPEFIETVREVGGSERLIRRLQR
jgi:hypothetical protein